MFFLQFYILRTQKKSDKNKNKILYPNMGLCLISKSGNLELRKVVHWFYYLGALLFLNFFKAICDLIYLIDCFRFFHIVTSWTETHTSFIFVLKISQPSWVLCLSTNSSKCVWLLKIKANTSSIWCKLFFKWPNYKKKMNFFTSV